MNWKKTITKIGKWAALALASFILLAALVFGLAQTELGKGQIVKLTAKTLTPGDDVRVEIGKLRGLIPFHFQLDHLALSDADGPLMTAENVALHWSPAALMRNQLYIREFSAATIKLTRLPRGKEKALPTSKDKLPPWPEAFPSLRVDRFTIKQFSLGEALLGETALFSLEAKIKADLPGGIHETRVRIERVDGPEAEIRIHATLRPEGPVLTLDAFFEEAQYGLIASALGSPGPLAFSLQGKGQVRDWKGTFRADFPPIGQCESQIQVDMGKPMKVNAQGTLGFVAGYLPEGVASLLGPDARFSVAGRVPQGGTLALDRVILETGDLALELAGSLDLKKNRSKVRFTFLCNDIQPLSTMFKVPSAGRLKAKGSISGPLLEPEADVHLTLRDVAFDRLTFSNMDGQFRVEFLEPLSSALPRLHLKGRGEVKGLTLQGSRLPPQRNIQWQMDIEGPTKEVFLIKEVKAKSEGTGLNLSGRLKPSASTGELDVVLDAAEPQALTEFFDLKLPETGRSHLNAHVEGALKKGFLSASFRGSSQILDQQLGPVFGKEIVYAGHIALEEGNLLTLSDLDAETTAGTLAGKASYNLESKTVNASWRVSIPELQVFSALLKRPLHGSLQVNGACEGPLSNIKLSVEAVCQHLFVGGVPLGETNAAIRASGFPPKSQGNFSIQVRPNGHSISAKADYALDGDRLALTRIRLEGLRTELSGMAVLDIAKRLPEGELRGQCDDLSTFAVLFGVNIGGSASVAARFEVKESDQKVIFTLEGNNVTTPLGQALQVGLRGWLRNPFNSPNGSAQLEVKDLHLNELTFSSSKIIAEGDRHQITFTATTAGHYKENFELETSGLFSASPGGQTVTLYRLQSRYGELPVALAEPIRIARSETNLTAGPFLINMGSGVMAGKGRVGKGTLALEVTFEGLPLRASRYFGVPSLTGTATGTVLLRGSPQHPGGFLRLRIENIGLDGSPLPNFPAGTLDIKAEFDQHRLQGEANLQRLTAKPFRATIDLPLVLSFSPFTFSVPLQSRLNGSLNGEVHLTRLVSLFGRDDQKMTGKIDLNLSLGGKAETPEIKGRVLVQKATYENLRSGTILKDVDVEITTTLPRLTIERARGTDGDSGTISAQGWLDILPSQGYPFRLDLTFEHTKLLRHDMALATTRGQLTLSGSLSEALLKGNLFIESAEFRIPERLPTEIADLEVTEINRDGEVIQSHREKRAQKNEKLKLDISIVSPGQAFVRGRGFDSDWKGELKVTGTASEPIIKGRISMVRGGLNFLGKRFNLTRGLLSFDGMTPPSLLLDMLGEARSKDITARLELSGSLRSPELKLSSDPTLPTDEILSRLLFGRSVTQITPLQAVQLANAVNTMAGGGGLDFMGKTREALRLDQLEVKHSGDQLEGTTLSAGKYLSDTVYLEVEQGLGPDSGKASVQWEITPNISVETEVGVNAEGGAGVNWKWDY